MRYFDIIRGEFGQWHVFRGDRTGSEGFLVKEHAWISAKLLDAYWDTPSGEDKIQRERLALWEEIIKIMRERRMLV